MKNNANNSNPDKTDLNLEIFIEENGPKKFLEYTENLLPKLDQSEESFEENIDLANRISNILHCHNLKAPRFIIDFQLNQAERIIDFEEDILISKNESLLESEFNLIDLITYPGSGKYTTIVYSIDPLILPDLIRIFREKSNLKTEKTYFMLNLLVDRLYKKTQSVILNPCHSIIMDMFIERQKLEINRINRVMKFFETLLIEVLVKLEKTNEIWMGDDTQLESLTNWLVNEGWIELHDKNSFIRLLTDGSISSRIKFCQYQMSNKIIQSKKAWLKRLFQLLAHHNLISSSFKASISRDEFLKDHFFGNEGAFTDFKTNNIKPGSRHDIKIKNMIESLLI